MFFFCFGRGSSQVLHHRQTRLIDTNTFSRNVNSTHSQGNKTNSIQAQLTPQFRSSDSLGVCLSPVYRETENQMTSGLHTTAVCFCVTLF